MNAIKLYFSNSTCNTFVDPQINHLKIDSNIQDRINKMALDYLNESPQSKLSNESSRAKALLRKLLT